MKLGIIANFNQEIFCEEVFRSTKEKELEFLEFCINVGNDVNAYINETSKLQVYLNKYSLKVGSVGRWGTNRILEDGSINPIELEAEKSLIRWCHEIGCDVYVTGCNYVDDLSLYENCTGAIRYFEELIACGKENGVKIAVYNCRWNNFVHSDPTWSIILGHLPDLYIKYDTSHSVYDKGDYLLETKKWGHRFAHAHIKGSLIIGGERYDDPPAGLDQINWGAFISTLYRAGYDGNLSIEPHSATWKGELGEKGLNYTIRYMKNLTV
ncbi:MAG: sugar phosphate isomerase/epimerase [Anaerolineaceae bacterium]|nr:MAG: sugar phosphate isomerase/epimerase [Anaerolineaceae bacterium]